MPQSAVHVLVIGTGSIGLRHAANLVQLGAKVTQLGWRQTSLAEVTDKLTQVDAAVIATATDIRLPLIRACAEAGTPVYIEKPLAFAPDELVAIADVAVPIAQRSMLGYMMRYHPAFRVLASSDLSDVVQFTLTIGHDVTQWRANWRFSDSYAARAQGGGVLLDLCHELDMACCLFPGLGVTHVDSLGHARFPGVDMLSRVGLAAPDGALGEVSMDYLTPALHRRCILHGTRQMFDFDFAAQRYTRTDARGAQDIAAPLERNAMFLDAMRDFLALVRGQALSDVEHPPRLDLCLPSAHLVANAWAARRFVGMVAKELT